jgi:hypothetical protein
MRKACLNHAIVVMLLAAWFIAACGPASPTAVPPTAPPPSRAPAGQCGDGVCDGPETAESCPQDCAQPTLSAADTPPPSREPAGQCGDGRCAGPETYQSCPQDCDDGSLSTGSNLPPASGVPEYEPPINVLLILHIDPPGQEDTFIPDIGMYAQTHDEIDWLMDEAARHGLHFTALFNGWYPQWALEEGDISQFRALLDAGHDLGSHAHRISYDATTDTWIRHVEELSLLGQPNYDPELARQCWNGADQFMDTVLSQLGVTGQNQAMCSTALRLSDEKNLMAEFGFTVAAGNRLEKGINYFGHFAWNPWRPANLDEPGYELAENLDAGYIVFNHLAQIGRAEAHGQDLSLPQMQRRFLMLYAEWLSRERTGAEDRVWTFGFVYHPNYGDLYNADTAAFLDWLDKYFVGQDSPYGHTIARYATVSEMAQEFIAWEAAHPGTSSFNYVRADPYPYTYAIVPTMLADAVYEAHMDLGAGVTGFRFSKDGQPIYMLWSDQGERTVDLHELSGQVRVTDSTGSERVQDAAALTLTTDPLFVEPSE